MQSLTTSVLIFALPARYENHMCSHPRTSAAMATAKKIAQKNGEKFNELNFSQQNHFVTRVATTAPRQQNNFQKKSHHHHNPARGGGGGGTPQNSW